MRTLKIYGSTISENYLDEIVEALRDGQVIVYPTDTLYAFGCDALNNRAIETICRIKDIDPRKQRLSIVCESVSQAAGYARIDNRAFEVMKRNLPGPFTFILPTASVLPKAFKGRREVGVRVPDDPIARQLAEALGNPLLSTSIELCGVTADVSDVASAEIAGQYGRQVALMVEAGPRGVEGSAIVDLTDSSSPEILRDGPQPLA